MHPIIECHLLAKIVAMRRPPAFLPTGKERAEIVLVRLAAGKDPPRTFYEGAV